MIQTYLITGCSRGIGNEMVKQLTKNGQKVIATCRDLSSLESLNEFPLRKGLLLPLELDIDSDLSIGSLRGKLENNPDFLPINVLINNAGILVKKTGSDWTRGDLRNSFETNSISPLILTQSLLPFLAPEAKIVMIGSRMGSIGDNLSSGLIAYRTSKSALNMIVKCLSLDLPKRLPKAIVLSLHPGWVQTDMGRGAGNSPPLTVHESVKGLLDVIKTSNQSHNGKFINWEGKELVW